MVFNLFFYCVTVKMICSIVCYSEQFIANFIPCFLQFSFDLLCMALLVLKNKCYLLKMLLSDLEVLTKYISDIWSDQVNYR